LLLQGGQERGLVDQAAVDQDAAEGLPRAVGRGVDHPPVTEQDAAETAPVTERQLAGSEVSGQELQEVRQRDVVETATGGHRQLSQGGRWSRSIHSGVRRERRSVSSSW